MMMLVENIKNSLIEEEEEARGFTHIIRNDDYQSAKKQ